MIEIPGDYGSGSGTIVRLSVAFSAVTGEPVRITKIRAKRPNPGLRHQHLEAIRTIARISSGVLKGDKIGSTEIEFYPGELKGGVFDVNIETAGSIGLLMYAALIPSVFARENVILNIKGGSIASMWSPPVPYIKYVLLHVLEKMGVHADIQILKHGFYPKGGSEVRFSIKHSNTIKPLNFTEFGNLEDKICISVGSKSLKNARVAERQMESAKKIIGEFTHEKIDYVESLNPGSFILIYGKTDKGCIFGSDSIGQKGKPAEVVGEEAALKFKEIIENKPTVDENLVDQLIPFMALANGRSEILVNELTDHIKTNMWLCDVFLKTKFEIKEDKLIRIISHGMKGSSNKRI